MNLDSLFSWIVGIVIAFSAAGKNRRPSRMHLEGSGKSHL